ALLDSRLCCGFHNSFATRRSSDLVSNLIEAFPETLPGPARDALGVTAEGTRFDTALEGRRSYQVGLDVGVTNAYPHLRHIVISRSEEHTSELQSRENIVCRLLLET